jgi:hypothetical protein
MGRFQIEWPPIHGLSPDRPSGSNQTTGLDGLDEMGMGKSA